MRTLLFLLLGTFQLQAQTRTFDITQFGAKADGQTVNTLSINEAVRACHAAGGGTVRIPVGTFVSGTVRLLDHVNLHLDAGAVLKGSPNLTDYVLDGAEQGLLFAFEARNVSLTGPGTVDGNSQAFFDPNVSHYGKMGLGFERRYTRQGEAYMPPGQRFADGPITYDRRPGMLGALLRCEGVRIEGVRLLNSPEWTLRLGDCDDVLVHGITIQTDLLVPNSDGIHCTTSRNVRISDCLLRCGDDAIAITGFGDEYPGFEQTHPYPKQPDYAKRTVGNRTGVCENIVVSNCILQSRSAGVRVGYGDNSIRNCLFQNLVIYDSHRGIGVFNRDRATIENIRFDHVQIQTRLHSGHWWGKGEPIHVSSIRQRAEVPVGPLRNVQFTNVVADAESGVVLWGTPESRLQDLRFENVQLTLRGGPLSTDWGGNVDLRPSWPAERQLFRHDIPGLFATHVDGLTLRDVAVRWGTDLPAYFTHALAIEEATNVRLTDFVGTGARPGVPPTRFTKITFAKP
jgi:hypothetical protein